MFFLSCILALTPGGCIGKPWMPPPTSTHFAPDMTGDCLVSYDDLLFLLGRWGSCEEQAALCGCPPELYCCRADLNRDGVVGMDDLIVVLDALYLDSF